MTTSFETAAPVKRRRNILTPRISNHGAYDSDTLKLLASVMAEGWRLSVPASVPPRPQMAGGRGTLRSV